MQLRPSLARSLCARLGLSLLELTVGMVLIVAISLYFAGTLVTDQQAQAVKLEMRRNMRSVANTIERDIRRAGFMVPASGAVCGVDNLGSADLLYLSDADVLDPEHGAAGHDNGVSIPGENVVGGLNPEWSIPLLLDAMATYDNDGDGVADADDNFPSKLNPSQSNTDGDEFGNACDSDKDNDSVLNGADSCPRAANTDGQADDADGDGRGDACDACADTEQDGVTDRHGCSIAQECPCEVRADGTPWKSHNKYYRCVRDEAKRFKSNDLITKEDFLVIRSAAKASECGAHDGPCE